MRAFLRRTTSLLFVAFASLPSSANADHPLCTEPLHAQGSQALALFDPAAAVAALEQRYAELARPNEPMTADEIARLSRFFADARSVVAYFDLAATRPDWANERAQQYESFRARLENLYFSAVERALQSRGVRYEEITLVGGERALRITDGPPGLALSELAAHVERAYDVDVYLALESLSANARGHFSPRNRGIALGHLILTYPEIGLRTLWHEARHAYYFNARERFRNHLFHGLIKSTDDQAFIPKANGFYDTHMSFEEIATHVGDIQRASVDWIQYASSDEGYDRAYRELRLKIRNTERAARQAFEVLDKFLANHRVTAAPPLVKRSAIGGSLQPTWVRHTVGNARIALPLFHVKSASSARKAYWLQIRTLASLTESIAHAARTLLEALDRPAAEIDRALVARLARRPKQAAARAERHYLARLARYLKRAP